MPITQTLPLPFDGVSQQPDELRAPSVATAIDNFDFSTAKGFATRNGTKHIAAISGWTAATYANSKVHFIDRSATEKYMVVLNGTNIEVINLVANSLYGGRTAGQVLTVVHRNEFETIQPVPAYMTSSNPKDDFRLLTVGDNTFIVNRSITVSDSGGLSGPMTTYDTYTLDTTKNSASQITSAPGTNTLYRIDGLDPRGTDTQYYAVLAGSLVIKEAHAKSTPAGLIHNFNLETVPTCLTFDVGTGVFTLRPAYFDKQFVGSDANNPKPSMIGRQVRDVFIYRNRIGFITRSTVILSSTIKYTNPTTKAPRVDLYRKTVTAVLDDDPIDVSVSHPLSPVLHHAGVYNNSLMIFGSTVQFQAYLQGDVVSPLTFGLSPLLQFECSETIRPINFGPKMYFCQPNTSSLRIRELRAGASATDIVAAEVSEHCPNYVSAGAFEMVTSASEGVMLVASKDFTAPNGIFGGPSSDLYVFRQESERKPGATAGSAWSRIKLSGVEDTNVVGLGFSSATLYLLLARPSGVFLETLDWSESAATVIAFSETPFASGMGLTPLAVCLDRQVTYLRFSGTYSSVTGRTTWTAGYPTTNLANDLKGVVTQSYGPYLIGEYFDVDVDSPTVISAFGDYSNHDVVIGIPVAARLALSRIQMRSSNGQPNIGGKLRIKTMELSLRGSGPALITPLTAGDGTPHTGIVGGVQIGESAIGTTPSSYTGRGRVAVNVSAEKAFFVITNVSPLRIQISGITWEGEYMQRTKRM